MAIYLYGADGDYDTPQEAFDACQEANETGSNGAVTFTGSGLNDLTAGGIPESGVPVRQFRVQIDGTGTPDTFKWSIDGGSTWAAETVAITGTEQTLQDGVSITFANTTGHTLNDRWDWETEYTSSNFTEANYIRAATAGIYEAFDTGTPVVRLVHSTTGRGVLPTRENPLIFDKVYPTYHVIFSDTEEQGCLIGSAADGSYPASYIKLDGLILNSNTGPAVITKEAADGSWARDWNIYRCQLISSSSAIKLCELSGLKIIRSLIKAYGTDSALIYADQSALGPCGGLISILNSILICPSGYGLYLVGGSGAGNQNQMTIAIQHVSFFTLRQNIYIDQPEGDFGHLIMLNSIFYNVSETDELIYIDHVNDGLISLFDGNVLYAAGGANLMSVNALALAGIEEIRSYFSLTDDLSVNADPLYTNTSLEDLTLQSSSPARCRGRSGGPSYEGKERSFSIDAGAYQDSAAGSWDVAVSNGEITANISGRIRAAGL